MRKLLGLAIAAALSGSTALATDLNVRIVSDTGFDMVTVSPGATVNYEVLGVLSSSTDNEGLALFGFDLVFDGGDLGQAVTPTAGSIASFVIPEGITNPAGFGGTANVPGREGDLVQIGGGLNTINNVETNAPYPIADAVETGIGYTEVVLAAGSLTAPDVEGTYTLSLSNLFANVIKLGESEDGTYWAVEEANVGTIENLMIEVSACMIVSTNPPDCAIDARQPSKPDGTVPAGWGSIDVTFSDASCAAAVGPGDFSVSVHPAESPPTITDAVVDGDTVTLVFDRLISTSKWTCVAHGEATMCLGSLPADVSGDSTSAPADILYLIDCLNGVRTCEMWQCDVDRSDMCGPPDILRVIDLLNGAGTYASWLNKSMPIACPTAP